MIERRSHWVVRVLLWPIAPFDDRIRGLSLTRCLAIAIFSLTGDVAHDWIEAKLPLGWAFAALVLGGTFLSVVTALGSKYIGRLLDIVAAKLGDKLKDSDAEATASPT